MPEIQLDVREEIRPEFFKDVASQVAKAYTILCQRSKKGGDGADMTILWRARHLLHAYDALIGYYHDLVLRYPTDALWSVAIVSNKEENTDGKRSGQASGPVSALGSTKKASGHKRKAQRVRRVRSRSKAR